MIKYTTLPRIAIAACAATLLCLPPAAQAVDRGRESPYDFRIRTVEYNPMDTVRVDGIAGLATHIQVAPDEEYVTHAFGQSGGWAFSNVENNYFIRPMSEESDTNLTIVTTKRTYHLLLHYIGSYMTEENGEQVEHFIETPWSMRQAVVALRFNYPMEDMAQANEALQQRRLEKALDRVDPAEAVNLDYRMSNGVESRSIQPLNVWDNYTFTYFKFPRNATLPTLFVIGPDGEESVVNAEVEGEYNNIMVARQTAREWRIRFGDKVVGVVNDGFNPSLGGSASGTVSPYVERVIREDQGQDDQGQGEEQ